MNKISFYFNFTLSKLMAYMIFIVGSIFAFIYHDPTVLITISGISAGVLGWKGFTDMRENNNMRNNTPPPKPTPKKEDEEIG